MNIPYKRIEAGSKQAEAIAADFINKYRDQWDPWRALINQETTQDKIFGLCVNFENDLKELKQEFYRNYLELFYKSLQK